MTARDSNEIQMQEGRDIVRKSGDICVLEAIARDPRHLHSRAQWPEMDLSVIDDRRGNLPDFPTDVLKPHVAHWLEIAAHGAGVMVDHVIPSTLAIASSLLGAAYGVRASEGYVQPICLWTVVVGSSGDGKTPGQEVSTKALTRIVNNRKMKIAEMRREHDRRVEAQKIAEKKWKSECVSAGENGISIPTRPAAADPVGQFVEPRLLVSDATIEKLGLLLQARPRGIVLAKDELSGMFENMQRHSRGGSDRTFYLEAYNGGSFTVERMGRPSVQIDHMTIAVTGGMQPDKISTSFGGDSDGMSARFQFVWPARAPLRPLTNELGDSAERLQTAFMRLIDLPDTQDGVFIRRLIPLSAEALEMFEEFRAFHYKETASLDGREREWWSKGPNVVLRLTGTLAFFSWAMGDGSEPTVFDVDAMSAAIRLWREYFWPHARACLRQIGFSDRNAVERRIVKWVLSKDLLEVSLTDIRRHVLAGQFNAEQTRAILDGLARAGIARQRKVKTKGRSAERWEFNPDLFEWHASR